MDEELNVLKSIYSDDLIISPIDAQTSITIPIYSHGEVNDFDPNKRLLCVTLIAELPSTYPDIDSPKITLRRSRGLADEQLHELGELISSCLAANRGSCVLYECIEEIRSKLTSYELPAEACAICLTALSNRNEIIRTNCHHFYHRECLALYVQSKQRELEEKYSEAKKNGFHLEKDFRNDIKDPVCGQILSADVLEQLPLAPSPSFEGDLQSENQALIQTLSPSIRLWQERTQALLRQQQEKGGTIDLDRTKEMIFG